MKKKLLMCGTRKTFNDVDPICHVDVPALNGVLTHLIVVEKHLAFSKNHLVVIYFLKN